jgi:hypothetical protein
MSDLLIEESDVSLASLSLALERAMIEHISPDKKSLYIREPGMFPFWVEIHSGPKYILLRTIQDFSDKLDAHERLSLCNDINLKLFVPSVGIRSTKQRKENVTTYLLTAFHPLYYRDGILTSHFIRMCRNFSDGMEQIKEHFDPDQQILIPLGQENDG